ncbi:MAG: hypothetical protein IJX51_08540 [Clostridia bacterium]|nr:hypothetical protein [Clostridia bacterium]
MAKKRLMLCILTLITVVLCAALLSACNLSQGNSSDNTKCKHEWQSATCQAPKTCKLCKATEGNPIDHSGGVATCTERAVCSMCNIKYGDFAQHVWGSATCLSPMKCKNCSATNGAPLDHRGGKATCTERAKCSECNTEYGGLGNHDWNAATCTAPQTCNICLISKGGTVPHTGGTATCISKAVCSECDTEYGDFGSHIGGTATCTNKAVCSECDAEYGDFGSHSWNDATCLTPKTCSVCSNTEGELGSHSWSDATCLSPKTCSVCSDTEGDPLPHTGGTATCISKAVCSECDTEYGELDSENHTEDLDWVTTDLSHKQVYPCCSTDYTEPSPHTMENGVCTVCGYTNNDPIFSVSSSSSHQGAQYQVTVSLENNPCLSGIEFRILYNEDAMTLTSIQMGSAFSNMHFETSQSYSSGCKFIWDTFLGDTGNGDILILTFSVNDSANAGSYSIVLSELKAYNRELELTNPITVNGTVDITAHFGGTATCTSKAVCSMCHNEYGELDSNNHTEEAEWNITVPTHNRIYPCCNTNITDPAPHILVDDTCTECGYVRPPMALTLSSDTTYRNDMYKITVMLENNPGLIGLEIKTSFDTSVMNVTAIANGTALEGMTYYHTDNYSSLDGCKFMWDSLEPNYGNGELVTFYVMLEPNVSPGEYSVTLEYARGYDADVELVAFTVEGTSFTVPNAQ